MKEYIVIFNEDEKGIARTWDILGEIVRCKDCKHKDADDGFCKGRGWPMQLVPEDGFCDKGERRTDERMDV